MLSFALMAWLAVVFVSLNVLGLEVLAATGFATVEEGAGATRRAEDRERFAVGRGYVGGGG